MSCTRSQKVLLSLSLILCSYFAISFLLLILDNFWPGPLFDYWVDIPLIEKSYAHSLTFSDLVTAHNNAHRILIPRLLFILDYQYFSATNVLLIAVSLLCKAITVLLFNLLLKKQSLATRLCLNTLLFAAVLNAGGSYNVLFNFDIQWDLVSVFACCAIFFYTRLFESRRPLMCRLLAYVFLGLAFLSHAGALSLPFVFIIISLFNQKRSETVINCILLVGIFYLNSILPIADPKNPDAQSAFTTLIAQPDAVLIFIIKFVSGSLIFYLGTPGYYFSAYILLLFTAGTVMSIRNRHIRDYCCHNIFLYFAFFLFLMIVSIAAARSIFSPNVWAASRFQTTVLLFILSLHIHAWLCAADFFRQQTKFFVHALIALHGLSMFLLIQYHTYNIPYKLSNAVYFSHAYMLTHGRNHNNGPRLLLWIHDEDVIAGSDTFFRRNGLAWYADKQVVTETGADFIDTGKTLVAAEKMTAFRQSCTKQLAPLNYKVTPEGGIEFFAAIDNHRGRTTWYAIDRNGVVAGFGYIFASESGWIKNRSIQGYSVSENISFFVEVDDDHQPVCLYSIENNSVNNH